MLIHVSKSGHRKQNFPDLMLKKYFITQYTGVVLLNADMDTKFFETANWFSLKALTKNIWAHPIKYTILHWRPFILTANWYGTWITEGFTY